MKKTINLKLYYQIAKENFSGFLELKIRSQGLEAKNPEKSGGLVTVNDSKIFVL